jgi:hypothetical protein
MCIFAAKGTTDERRMRGKATSSPWRAVLVLAAIQSLASCVSRPPYQDPYLRPQIDWKPNLVLSAAQAERILGEQTRQERTTAYTQAGVLAYQSSFRADTADLATGKTGVLGYMYEEYNGAEAAKSYLYSTLRENHLRPEDGILMENGAELHYMTGGHVVRMVMILRGNHLVRLKVNPTTSHYSLSGLKSVAEELAQQL